MYVFLKNKFVPKNEALISIDERGFKFGDGVFETIRIHNIGLYQWDLHLARLNRGINALKINIDLSSFKNIALELIDKNSFENGLLRIMVTRGEGSNGYLPLPSEPTIVFETLSPIKKPTEPVDLWCSTVKKIPPSSLPPVKTMQGLNSILARLEAKENNCFESLQFNINEEIVEASSSNIFWVNDEIIYTPSLKTGALAGTTRDAVIRISPYKIVEGEFLIASIENAHEVFLTNVAWGVLSVKSLNPNKINYQQFDISSKLMFLLEKDIENYKT